MCDLHKKYRYYLEKGLQQEYEICHHKYPTQYGWSPCDCSLSETGAQDDYVVYTFGVPQSKPLGEIQRIAYKAISHADDQIAKDEIESGFQLFGIDDYKYYSLCNKQVQQIVVVAEGTPSTKLRKTV